jgi:hypothetical protein
MSKKAAVKLTRVNRDALEPTADVERYCRGLNDWRVRGWHWNKTCCQTGSSWPAFVHSSNTWWRPRIYRRRPFRSTSIIFGYWVERSSADLNDPSLRKKPIEQILFHVIDDDGGPLIYGVTSEEQQRSFDSTCRKVLTDFSVRFVAELVNHPQIPLRRQFLKSSGYRISSL